jgi:hypothetical protein
MKTDHHGRICDTVPISERPATAEDRVFGSADSQIATLVERPRYLMLPRVASKDTETVVKALMVQAGWLPQ